MRADRGMIKSRRAGGLVLTVLSLSTASSIAASSSRYVSLASGFTAGSGAMASATYRQSPALDPGEAPGTSTTASQHLNAGLFAFLGGRSATVADAPALVRLVPVRGEIKVFFAPPAYNGGADITTYTATCTPVGGASVTGSGTTSPLLVTGLTNGVSYSCGVTAHNRAGDSASSGLLAQVVRPLNLVPILGILLD